MDSMELPTRPPRNWLLIHSALPCWLKIMARALDAPTIKSPAHPVASTAFFQSIKSTLGRKNTAEQVSDIRVKSSFVQVWVSHRSKVIPNMTENFFSSPVRLPSSFRFSLTLSSPCTSSISGFTITVRMNQAIRVSTTARGAPISVHCRKVTSWPAMFLSRLMHSTLIPLPTGVANPPRQAAMGIPIIMLRPNLDLPGRQPFSFNRV